jgi:hypothetical protein
MGPGVLLVPAALVLCLVTTGLLLWHWSLLKESKAFLTLAGASALLAAFMVYSYILTEIFLDHLHELERIQGEPVLWYFLNEWPRAPRSGEVLVQCVVAFGLAAWGFALLHRAWIRGTAMTLLRALSILVASTLVFAAIGCGFGAGLGKFVPNFYRNIYMDGHSAAFDPVSVGIGLGLIQGAAGGAVIGLVLVAILAKYASRKSEKMFFEEIPLE